MKQQTGQVPMKKSIASKKDNFNIKISVNGSPLQKWLVTFRNI